jgi:uncharacterized membrane protein
MTASWFLVCILVCTLMVVFGLIGMIKSLIRIHEKAKADLEKAKADLLTKMLKDGDINFEVYRKHIGK